MSEDDLANFEAIYNETVNAVVEKKLDAINASCDKIEAVSKEVIEQDEKDQENFRILSYVMAVIIFIVIVVNVTS
ncbi:hypothetical protein H5200_23310 [Pseudoalteromonas sp. SG43-7]|uniref:hypothetical protein n=1 Tax=Pseudoalteromonas sp. SG43-7 TaxID=2760966 RepID=UPI0016002850|nr:hypothetical protein [Pseudoalteromonas sp. SG43-7]MBB1424781.1 hypothetical protein [Pseudoalteromonas sp. SG43-7]